MAFESLTERMSQAFKNLTGQGKLTEKNMNDMLKEVRMSLLEAGCQLYGRQRLYRPCERKSIGRTGAQRPQSGADGRKNRP